MRARLAIVLASATAAAACASNAEAPVVYGSEPTWQGRVYSSADELPPTPAAGAATAPAGTEKGGSSRGRGVELAAVEETSLEGSMRRAGADKLDSSRIAAGALSVDDIYLEDTLAGGTPGSRARADSAGYVRVASGDTVYAISRRTGASPASIIAINGLRAPYRLDVGQTLRVPASARIASNDAKQAPTTRAEASPRPTPAKIVQSADRGVRRHVVRSGDTLYAISRASGTPVAELARLNGLRSPYALQVGDEIRLPDAGPTPILANATPPRPAAKKPVAEQVSFSAPAVADAAEPLFSWPLRGAVVDRFRTGAPGERNDGIDIAAPVGTPVRAAADGEVVYRGAGLDGYGNLLLIRHADGFVTAYAHNDVMLVRKGQQVRKGQVIAKVGQTGETTQPRLHFEIRQNLKAVDPMAFLGS